MDYSEIEIEGMKEILRDKEEYIKKLEIDKIHWRDLYWEECEKNKKLKEELDKLKKQQLFSLGLDEDDNRKAKRTR